jgi:hypothetical protein
MTNRDDDVQEAQEMRHNSRMLELGRQAFDRAIALKLGALEAAKAAIDATFGPRNNAVKRLAHQIFECGPTHPAIRLQYHNFARALDGCEDFEPLGLDEAIVVFHSRWAEARRWANNEDLSVIRRRDAAFLATRYRAILIALRYLRSKGITPNRFEAIRQSVISGRPR